MYNCAIPAWSIWSRYGTVNIASSDARTGKWFHSWTAVAAVWVRGKEAEFESIRWPVGTWKAWWKRVAGLIFYPPCRRGFGSFSGKMSTKVR